MGVIASDSLAAILWSAQAKPKPIVEKPRFKGIIGTSREIEEVCNLIKIASGSDATVLIEGESGTGKELVVKAIHQGGTRSDGPLITVDCGAIPETLIESELFGSRKGSFTGATSDRAGLVEAANGGTLFLDEISNTSQSLQVKLLRVLQEREVRRIGDTHGRPVDIRLLAATNANLEERVQKGTFRQDLLYRLKVLHVVVPPLRHRRKDIPDIARSVLDRLNATHKTRKRFGRPAIDQLMAGNYAGNVRELQNVVERAYFMTTDSATIKEAHVDSSDSSIADENEVLTWFEDLTGGRKDFWSTVHKRYKRRDISREKVVALMDLGLRATRGSYKSVASLFRIKESEHRKFVDFLRRNHCQPDFRPYRKLPEASAPQALP
jgi:transcriptional regulator with PAS, ATPase and Fis domain